MNLEAKLTKREIEIAERSAWGAIKKEIADSLKISPNTVVNHMRNIYVKTEVRSVNQLSAWWFSKHYKITMPVLSVLFICLVTVNEFNQADTTIRTSRSCKVRTSKRKHND